MSTPTHIIPEVVKNVAVIRVEGISTDWHQYVVDIDPVPADQPLRLVVWLRDTKEKIRPDDMIDPDIKNSNLPTKLKSEVINDADTTLVIDDAKMDCKTGEIIIKETEENIFDIINPPGQSTVIYHAEPVRLLNRSHWPEGFCGPRIITDWGVSPAFPPMAPTIEEFYEMFHNRELSDNEDEATDDDN